MPLSTVVVPPIEIQSGTSKFGASNTTGEQSVTVTFPRAFSSAPKIAVTWSENYSVFSYMNGLTVSSVSTTGFTVKTKRILAGYEWNFHWIATNA